MPPTPQHIESIGAATLQQSFNMYFLSLAVPETHQLLIKQLINQTSQLHFHDVAIHFTSPHFYTLYPYHIHHLHGKRSKS